MRTNFNHINKYRVKTGPLASQDSMGPYGFFIIPSYPAGFANGKLVHMYCMSAGADEPESEGWEHVSCRTELPQSSGGGRIPTWQEMCMVKHFFWLPDEVVIQFHPAEKDYVNKHPHVLHLWRNVSGMATPPKSLIG